MPWSKVDGSEVEECADDQIAVVKDEDGTVEGCHDTEEEANEQIAALEASEEEDDRSVFEAGGNEEGIQRRAVSANIREHDDEDLITFEISNDALDRHGTRLEPEGADLENYKKNPVVLYGHGFGPNGDVPIGRAENIFSNEGGLFAHVRFDEQDDFAREIKRKVEDGFLSGASVGFDPNERVMEERNDGSEIPVFTDWELLEFSIVSVPSNPDALVEGRNAYTEQLAERVAEIVTKRIESQNSEEDASSADGVARGNSDDESGAASDVDDDDSQAPSTRDVLKKLVFLNALSGDGRQIDEDKIIDRVLRKLGKR